MAVSLYDLAQDTKAVVSRVMSNFTALAQKFTEGSNGINDGDISTNAGIKGSKLSNVAGNRVPTDRLEDDAVDATKLRDAAAIDSNRAVTTNHIRDAAITSAKLADAAGLYAKLKSTSFSWTPGGVFNSGTVNSISTGKTAATSIPHNVRLGGAGAITAHYIFSCFGVYLRASDNTYYLFLGNVSDAPIDLTGLTVHVDFLEKA